MGMNAQDKTGEWVPEEEMQSRHQKYLPVNQ